MSELDLVLRSYELGKRVLEKRPADLLKEHGQFLTPPSVARFMAKQLGSFQNENVILDPAVGSGVLICAVIERLIFEGVPLELQVEAYETDSDLCILAREMLAEAAQKAEQSGIRLHWQVHQEDFILACLPDQQPALFGNTHFRCWEFDHIICNPPYFKLHHDDGRVKLVAGKLNGHTNIYTLFMALSSKLLAQHGKACFIVPRSFCSGFYFADFRRDLLKDITPLGVHVFQSRSEIFKGEDVLQENVIFSFTKSLESSQTKYLAGCLNISSSVNDKSLDDALVTRQVPFRYFVNYHSEQFFFRLPTGILDEQILDAVDLWDGSLEKYGLQISTGRVVPFRAKELLKQPERKDQTVPLLWMQNVKPYRVEYPLAGFEKPQAISTEDSTLLVPNAVYVLLRRFSAKEDRRRLIAAPLFNDQINAEQLGFENHLNFVYKKNGVLHPDEAFGLSALLNSAIVDRYFRIVNGNTQVNAAELRGMPLPPLDTIRQIGAKVRQLKTFDPSRVDFVVFSVLWQSQLLSEEFPMIQETRINMGKIEQAQEILELLGLPSAQQNEISALTLLALAQLSEVSKWKDAVSICLRVHDILAEIKQRYGREYAENTRETIRRQVLHQFEQAGLVLRNVDEPGRPTNSGLTNYTLSELATDCIRTYGAPDWEKNKEKFINQRGTLLDLYEKTREQNKVPLRVADGTVYKLSPGKHNQLQAAVVEEFGPRFAPGAKLLYLGDTARKILILEQDMLARLGVPVDDHGKFPDIIFLDEGKNRIFLVEAVTFHGPVSPKRHLELEEIFKRCKASRIYVTAFLDFPTFKRYINDIAWETEVWIAEIPSHMIHFNGDKFLAP